MTKDPHITNDGCEAAAVMEALRELRGRIPILKAAETPEEATRHLSNHVIHPTFFDGPASELAAEYLRDVLRIEPTEAVTLWALYTQAAALVLSRPDTVPVPAFGRRQQGQA